MKTNDYLFITTLAAYSYLFYEQNAGINFVIFNVLLAGCLYARDKSLLRNKKWCWALGLCLLSSLGILFNSGTLAIFANCCSLLLLSAFSFSKKTSAIFSFLFGCYSAFTAAVFMFIDGARRFEKKTDQNRLNMGRFLAVAVAAVLCFLFFNLYKASNPLFAENTRWLNLDFLSFHWLMFTLGGALLCYALFYYKTIKPVEQWENELPLVNALADHEQQERHTPERLAGTLLFVFLNAMLLILNVGDIQSIWFNGQLPKGITHTAFVHNGVGMLILSVLIATGLIMFLYRRNFDKGKGAKLLKALVYLWILQDLVMLFSTGCRNHMYIEAFNLTYKRVGVHAWLFAAALGHALTFLKLTGNRSNWYLVRSNFAAWFCVLAIASLVNWDVLITRHNLRKPVKEVDLYYLFSLSDANIPELLSLYRTHPAAELNLALKKSSYGYPFDGYHALLKNKLRHFLKDYNTDWQSWDLRDKQITESILNKK